MSGGIFDYAQQHILNIKEEIINEGKHSAEKYSPKTYKQFEDAVVFLDIAYVYARRIDWLLSGDDSEGDFHDKLAEDLQKFKTKSFRVLDAVSNPNGYLDAPIYEKHEEKNE